MKKYANRKVQRTEEVLVEIKCDECKTNIDVPEIDHYFEVRTGHCRWGNDSVDSWEDFDFCSCECLMKHIQKFLENGQDTDDYEFTRIDKRQPYGKYVPLVEDDILPF